MRRLVSQRFSGRESTVIHGQGCPHHLRGRDRRYCRLQRLRKVDAAIRDRWPGTGHQRFDPVRAQPTLLGVNAALKPELSGHRNIVVGGLAMGLKLTEVRAHMDDIAEFTELGEALDRPLRTYSSGMRARLAFSIATIHTPEILLIDEALAVGDKKFRAKSLARVREMQAEAGTIVMVTHNLDEVRKTCTRAVWLDQGILRMHGEVEPVLEAYESDNG